MAEPPITSSHPLPAFVPLVCKPQGHQGSDVTSGENPMSRKAKTSSIGAQEWELRKIDIHQLYVLQDRPLLEVMKIMEREKSFIQSRKQYTTKLKEWGYEKNIKEKDMRAIARKDLKRKAEDPLRTSAIRLRGKPVPRQRIARYAREKGLTSDHYNLDEATPSAISCDTPRSEPESPAVQPETTYEVVSRAAVSVDEISNPLCARVASAIINSDGTLCSTELDDILLPSSLSHFPNLVGFTLQRDLATAKSKLEIGVSEDHGSIRFMYFYSYGLYYMWRLAHGLLLPWARNPACKYRAPHLGFQWKSDDQLIAEGTLKIEAKGELQNHGSLISSSDSQRAADTDPGAAMERILESQEPEDCKCSLSCQTLAPDTCGNSEMGLLKIPFSRPADWRFSQRHFAKISSSCAVCCLAAVGDALTQLGPESLLSLLAWLGSQSSLYENEDFKLVWCSGNAIGEFGKV